MIVFFKKLSVPKTNEVKEIDAVQLWEVRWTSRYDKWHSSLQPEMECFTSEELANSFADSLRAAFKLVRNTSSVETNVTVRKVR